MIYDKRQRGNKKRERKQEIYEKKKQNGIEKEKRLLFEFSEDFQPNKNFAEYSCSELKNTLLSIQREIEKKTKRYKKNELCTYLYSTELERLLHDAESVVYFFKEKNVKCNSDQCLSLVMIARCSRRAPPPELLFKVFKDYLQTHRPKFTLAAAILTTYSLGARQYGIYFNKSYSKQYVDKLAELYENYFQYAIRCTKIIFKEHYTLNTYLYNILLKTCLDYPLLNALDAFWMLVETMLKRDGAGSNKCAPNEETYHMILSAVIRSKLYPRGLSYIKMIRESPYSKKMNDLLDIYEMKYLVLHTQQVYLAKQQEEKGKELKKQTINSPPEYIQRSLKMFEPIIPINKT